MRKSIIFDLDGTLVYTLPSLVKSGNEMLQHYGLPAVEAELYRTFLGNGSRMLVRRLLQQVDADKKVPEDEALAVYLEAYEKNCLYGLEAYEGMPEACEQLATEGYSLVVLTNKPHPMAVRVIESLYGTGFFDHILGQKVNAPVKPDKRLMQGLVDDLGIDPEESFFVGDSEVDIATAAQVNMPVVAVLWGYRSREQLEAAGSPYLAANARDLLQIIFDKSV
ncbi:MAG: HAD family hydrolase [Eubacteriales bacterium]|nr:HAD family hydrolase [Eubacteriales bacterium]